MNKPDQAEIYHLYHSGVAVKTANNILVFDYYRDSPAGGEDRSVTEGVITTDFLQQADNVLVFVTHSHSDHFNPVIFDWETEVENISYILSDDVRTPAQGNYYKVGKYEELDLAEVEIETYGTTDQGLSFLVKADGLNIFHSGDLNWWHWNKFSPRERKREEKDFKEELAKLKGKEIDIAFVPVDPRLEEHYYLAGEYFAQEIGPELLVPIHFSSNYSITEEFKKKISGLSVQSAVIKGRGEKISFPVKNS
jgi:L-ascorbate metabolism protein UlaG (beta-lactamase superfamily)